MWENSPRYDNRNGNGGNMHGNYGEYDSFDSQNDAHMNDSGLEHTYGGIRQLVQTSATSAREHSSSMNPYATLHVINRELMELGLPSPLLLPELAEYLEDNQRVVECLVTLLHQRKRDLGFRETMDDELRKAMGEEDLLRSTIARLERELDVSQREAAMNRVKWQESERQHSETETMRKKLAAELRTTRSNAAMVKAQFMHDGKKREQESIKLKDRLQKLITDKHRACKVHVELANPVERDRSGRPMDSATRDQMLRDDLLKRYDANEVRLVARVEELEDLLKRLEAALATLRDEVSPGMAVDSDEAVVVGGNATQVLALVDTIRFGYRQTRAAKPPPAVDPVEIERRDRQISELKQEIAALCEDLEKMRSLLEEQKRVMDMAASAAFKEPLMEMSFSEMSLEQVEAEREALRREKRQLEEERRRFTDAAIELGNERSELQRERQELESRRTAQGTTELLEGLPPTPQWMRGLDQTQATPLLLNQLKSMYQGTPTNELLASMYFAAATAAQTPHAGGSTKQPEEEFPEIDATGRQLLSPQQPTMASATAARLRGSHAAAAASPQKMPVRTPVDVRSARAPRVCTRPGCAAHAPHSHDDATPAMELKPPVPRFRKPESSPASRSPSRQEPPLGTSSRSLQRRPLNSHNGSAGARPPTATGNSASTSSLGSTRSHAANIFK
ncbi:hypothetical protein GGH94_001934 [Coemansia aciculifera]|uniref:Afadin and alpha-actinin-binding-domain-containing protein n=1 Tax=Coemansia aciculifera TaxID=417176 RepID=A0A9W8M5Z4_9FUNG|nr:hypothetical protein GGH94_001934 [Coemansia aciculifera]